MCTHCVLFNPHYNLIFFILQLMNWITWLGQGHTARRHNWYSYLGLLFKLDDFVLGHTAVLGYILFCSPTGLFLLQHFGVRSTGGWIPGPLLLAMWPEATCLTLPNFHFLLSWYGSKFPFTGRFPPWNKNGSVLGVWRKQTDLRCWYYLQVCTCQLHLNCSSDGFADWALDLTGRKQRSRLKPPVGYFPAVGPSLPEPHSCLGKGDPNTPPGDALRVH